MNILIVGKGGREHALAWKAAQSPLASRVFVAEGNAGTQNEPCIFNVALSAGDIGQLVDFAKASNVGLTIVGPEIPLANGICDTFAENGLMCFGPSREAAQMEASKLFAKTFMQRHSIPTAEYRTFSDAQSAEKFIDTVSFPLVIKADGLAAGKGVIIAYSAEEARFALHRIFVDKAFGAAGDRVVVEQFIDGEEASFICIVDGENIVELATSQDHKAAYDGDRGPNTGGMGAYSPASVIDDGMKARIYDTVIRPTVDGLREEGIEYKGFLYAGLIIGTDGQPRVLEFNCRLGDPEAQAIMMRMQSDLVELCLAGCTGELTGVQAKWDPRPSLGVVAVAGGYPGEYLKGAVIHGLDSVDAPDAKVFHAGTTVDKQGKFVVDGGRVLCVTAIADGLAAAQARAYAALGQIDFEDIHYRTDIGYRALERPHQGQSG